MSKRILLVVILTAWPFAALADDSSSAGTSTDPQATSGYNASNLGPSAGASTLGPSTSSGDSSGSSDSSTGAGSALQPAGSSSSPLQSDNNGQSLGASTSPASALQAPTTQNSLQVLQGEADGSPHTTDNSFPIWVWIALTAAFAAVVAAAIWLWRRPGSPRLERDTANLDDEAEPLEAPAEPAEPTTSQRLSITIDRPVSVVFDYVLNPTNTPKWVPALQAEEASEHPAKLGTIYKNQDTEGNWSEYEITQFTAGESFVLSKKDSTYHVRYTLSVADNDTTDLEYYEWMDEGNLPQPFTSKELQSLKLAIENQAAESTTAVKTEDLKPDKPDTESKPKRDKPAKA